MPTNLPLLNPLEKHSVSPLHRNRTDGWLNGLAFFFTGFVLLFYLYYIDSYSINFPYQDDNMLLEIIFEVKKGLGFEHNVKAFFRTDNDHRVFVPRVIAYVNYLLTGQPNFKAYIWLITGNLLLTLFLLYQIFRKARLPFWYFLPAPLLLLQPQIHDISLWALNGMQHSTLTLFLFICLFLLYHSQSLAAFWVAVVVAVLATFTHGNGILVFAAGGFLLLIEKHYRRLALWVGATLLCLAVYLYGYTPGSGVKTSTTLPYALGTLFATIGANVSVWPDLAITGSILWGLIISLVLWPAIFKSLFQALNRAEVVRHPNHLLLAIFCFLTLTAALIGAFRSNSDILIANRFKLCSALASIVFYLYLIINLAPRWRPLIFAFFTGTAFLFWFSSYVYYTPEVAQKKSRYVADTYNWPKNKEELCLPGSVVHSHYFLIPAYQQGYWNVPTLLPGLDEQLQSSLQQKAFQPFALTTQRFRYTEKGSEQLTVENRDIPFRRQSFRDDIFLLLHDENTHVTYVAGTEPRLTGYRRLLTGGGYFAQGFRAVFPLEGIRAGHYRLGSLLKKDDGAVQVVLSNTVVAL